MPKRRILVIRTGGLGDGLLLWPGICAMRRKMPQAQIELMGHRTRLELLLDPLAADRAIDVEGTGIHLLYELDVEPPAEVRERFGAYDTVVAFAAPGDYALAENLAACGAREVHAFLPFPTPEQDIHAADHVLESLARAELTSSGSYPTIPLSRADEELGRKRLALADLGPEALVLLAPGSGSDSKNWPAELYARLAEGLTGQGLTVALLAGPADEEAVGAVVSAAGDLTLPVLNDSDERTMKATIAQAQLYVGNDAGPTHLAGLLGLPTVALFGPSDPDRWRPLGPKVAVLRAEDGWLESLELSQVLQTCQRLL